LKKKGYFSFPTIFFLHFRQFLFWHFRQF
jgi:hypothetical protein